MCCSSYSCTSGACICQRCLNCRSCWATTKSRFSLTSSSLKIVILLICLFSFLALSSQEEETRNVPPYRCCSYSLCLKEKQVVEQAPNGVLSFPMKCIEKIYHSNCIESKLHCPSAIPYQGQTYKNDGTFLTESCENQYCQICAVSCDG